jgi:hypothetical protein
VKQQQKLHFSLITHHQTSQATIEQIYDKPTPWILILFSFLFSLSKNFIRLDQFPMAGQPFGV